MLMEKSTLGPLELEFRMIMAHPMWVPEIELVSSTRAVFFFVFNY